MSPTDSPVLVVATTAPTADALAWAAERFPGRKFVAVYLADDAEQWPLGDGWQRWTRPDLEDLNRLRREFLEFVEAWPRQSFATTGGKPFDAAFRRSDGYSLWWTGPGLARHPDRGVFPKIRDIWAFNAAIQRSQTTDVVFLSDTADVAEIVSKRCRSDGISFEVPPGYATPAANAWPRQLGYVCAAVARYLVSPWVDALRSIVCRYRVRCKAESSASRQQPAIVATALFPREFRRDGDAAHIAFWSEVAAELQRSAPDLRFRYLLHTTGDRLDGLGPDRLHCHRAWPELRRLDGLAPLPNRTVGWWTWLRAARPFLRTLINFCRLERQRDFRDSFRFAGCDVAPLYAPLLRDTIARTHQWAHNVASHEASLRSVGNVRAVLVYGEMYALGMPVIAAARNLGIVTIGTQHGTIFPMHLIYAVPQGQIDAVPVPDWFAAYGEYTKEQLSEHSAFPVGRIAVTGAPRLDALATEYADQSNARAALQLPSDKRIILFATQIYPWFKIAARALFAAAGQRRDCVVCVKTHPHETSIDAYRHLAEEAGIDGVRFYSDRFDELLAASDILVSGSSTAVLEAILLGRPTICVNFSGEADRYPYVAEGGSLGAASPRELRDAIDTLLDGSGDAKREADRRAFLVRHVGPSADGQAASTFVAKVLELFEGKDDGPGLRRQS